MPSKLVDLLQILQKCEHLLSRTAIFSENNQGPLIYWNIGKHFLLRFDVISRRANTSSSFSFKPFSTSSLAAVHVWGRTWSCKDWIFHREELMAPTLRFISFFVIIRIFRYFSFRIVNNFCQARISKHQVVNESDGHGNWGTGSREAEPGQPLGECSH